ncbi:MAG: thioredoxin family protein [Myxococcales bacterium]|nr:thioredoxin family protein [Myxococcales bacterium]
MFPYGNSLDGWVGKALAQAALVCVALGLGGCESGSTPHEAPPQKPPAEAKPRAAAAAPTPLTPKTEGIEWAGNIHWVSYEDGLAQARSEKKPLCVVVYADWCPRCRELARVFHRPDVERLAKDLVMVRQNADEPSDWLNQPPLAAHGKYVPRVFFFDRRGSFVSQITSSHPRYPFFYAAGAPEALTSSMRKAVALPL